MALRRLSPSNIAYKDRDIGGSVSGGPVAASPAPSGGIFASAPAPGDLVPLELEDAPAGYTLDDIIKAAAAVAETPEEAEEIIEEYIGEDGDRDTMQQLQDSAAALWRKNNYGSEDAIAPAVGATKPSAPGSYFQDIPSDVERVAPVAGFMGQDSLTGSDIKDPLKFIPKVATDKLPGEQHPGVDYSSVDRPLPEKNQGRLATESAKEAETYRGIFGGGSAFNEKWGGTDVYPDPTVEPKEGGGSASGDGLIEQVYTSFRKAGFNDNQAKALVAEVGRENSFREDLVFGSHKDPKNNATNVGFFSWQGDRAPKVMSALEKAGVVNKDGSIQRSQKATDVMAEFTRKEMESYPKTMKDFVNNPGGSYEDFYKTLGDDYIRWARTDPKYASSGAKNRDHYYNEINSKVAASPQGSPTEMLTRPGDYGFEQNRGVTDLAALESLVGSSLPGSVAEAHQQLDEAIAGMRERRVTQNNPKPFSKEVESGVNPPAQPDNMYQGVARPQDFAPEDPYAPRPVTTTPVAPLPTAPQMLNDDSFINGGDVRPSYYTPHYEQMLDQNILNNNSGGLPGSYYDPSQYAQTTPSGSFNLEREAETISGSSGSDLNGGSEGNLDQYQQFMEPSATMPTYPTGPAAGRGTPQYNGAFEPQNERELTGRSYGFPEVSTPAPAVKASGFAGDNPPVGGGTKTEYRSVPVWGYEYNPVTTTIANANQTEYEKAAGLNATVTKEVMEKVPVITGYEKKPYEVKVADDTKAYGKAKDQGYQGPQSQQPRTPRYSSKTQAMINAGMAQPAPSGVRQPVDFMGKGAQTGLKAGLGFGGVPGAITGGILGAVIPSITSGYNGIFNGGDTPALSNATQLGGAYDVYNDRSDRNTWAVSNNSGNIVSRDADTGWTGVTSNVNGKGPVTTITLRDGSTAASGFPGFGGGGGIFGSSSNEDGADNFTNGSGGTSSYGASGSVNSGGSSSGGGASGGSGSGGGGGFFSDLSDTVSGWFG